MPRLPPKPSPPAEIDRLRARITQLEADLYRLRSAHIELVPQRQQEYLRAWLRIDDREDFRAWMWWAIDGLLELADRRESADVDALPGQWRANCPLCDEEARNVYGGDGFSFPTGLKRHLLGSNGAYACSVFAAACSLAKDGLARREDPTRPRPNFSGPGFERPPKPWHVLPPSAAVFEFRPRSSFESPRGD